MADKTRKETMNDNLSAIRLKLVKSVYGDVRRVKVKIEDGNIVLIGNVKSYHMKQMAQETIKNSFKPIDNRLLVK